MAPPRIANINLPKNIDPQKVQLVLICEALPENPADYFYSSQDSLYVKNIIEAFKNAGIQVENINQIIQKGVYLTVAVKEVRKGLVVPTDMIEKYSYSLENELELFPNTVAVLLMGDTAIKALNFISRRRIKAKVIPSGPTYKIRTGKFYLGSVRVFPSYLPTGKNFLIEKAKRKMVSEDIKNAFRLIK